LITRREGEGWTLIRQMDHAAHCGELARAWRAGPFGHGSVSPALEYAAGYHDQGWTEVDRSPELDPDGQPRNFTRIDEARHTRFYSGAVRDIAATEPHAAYLVSLHASGLYSRRYGWSGLKPVDWTSIGPDGRALLAAERRFRAGLIESIEPGDLEFEAMWRSYMLLEAFDYLSLLTCFGFESSGCGPAPTLDGQWEHLSVKRLGPWDVEVTPFPFPGDVLELDVVAVHVEGHEFKSAEALRKEFESARPRQQTTFYRRMRSPG
jgi:hypothetical protein